MSGLAILGWIVRALRGQRARALYDLLELPFTAGG